MFVSFINKPCNSTYFISFYVGLGDYKQMETFLQDPPSNEYYDGQSAASNALKLGRADTAPMVHMQQNQAMNFNPTNYGGMYCLYTLLCSVYHDRSCNII